MYPPLDSSNSVNVPSAPTEDSGMDYTVLMYVGISLAVFLIVLATVCYFKKSKKKGIKNERYGSIVSEDDEIKNNKSLRIND